MRALELSFGNGYDTAPDDFRHVRAGVDRNDKQAGKDYVQRDAVVDKRKAPENYHCLHHHRRAAEYFDVSRKYPVGNFFQNSQKLVFRRGHRAEYADKQTDDKTDYRTDYRYEHRVTDALEYHLVIFGKYISHFLKNVHFSSLITVLFLGYGIGENGFTGCKEGCVAHHFDAF